MESKINHNQQKSFLINKIKVSWSKKWKTKTQALSTTVPIYLLHVVKSCNHANLILK